MILKVTKAPGNLFWSPMSTLWSSALCRAYSLVITTFSSLLYLSMYWTRSIAHAPTFWFSQKRAISLMSGKKVWVYVSYLKPELMENLSLNLGSTKV